MYVCMYVCVFVYDPLGYISRTFTHIKKSWNTYSYIHAHVHTDINMYQYIQAHIHTDIHTIHADITQNPFTYIHTYIQVIYIYAYIHTYRSLRHQPYMHTCIHTFMPQLYIFKSVYIHKTKLIHIHTYIYTYIHKYIHTQPHFPSTSKKTKASATSEKRSFSTLLTKAVCTGLLLPTSLKSTGLLVRLPTCMYVCMNQRVYVNE